MKKIHVLHITLFLRMGGLESIVMDMARNIDNSKFVLSVLCLKDYDEVYRSELEKKGVAVYHITRNGRFDFFFFVKIIRLLKEKRIDVIHSHSGCFFNSALCAKIAGMQSFIYTEHGLPLNNYGVPLNDNFKTRIEDQLAAGFANEIYAVSREISTDMNQRFPRSMHKVRIITNGVDTDRFKPIEDEFIKEELRSKFRIPKKSFVIGSVGRLVQIKNYESMISAVSDLINKKKLNVYLILVGDGPEKEFLEMHAKNKGIANNVFFAGVQYNIQNILSVFNVFVLPSWTEGTSISLLEALACGVPAVVSDVGENSTIVRHAVNGFVYEPGNVTELSLKLMQMTNNHKIYENMKIEARNTVNSYYSLKKMCKEYEKSYCKGLGKKDLS